MKRLLDFLFLVAAIFCAPAARCDSNVADADKLEKTRAILAENSNAKEAPTPSWRTEEQSLSGAGMSMVKSLVLCIGIFLVGAAIYRKFALKGSISAGRRIKIMERTPLSSRTFLSIVEVDGKTVLLACGPDRVSFAPTSVPTASCAQAGDFEKTLKAVCERKDS